jgi:hypothetical protein
MGWSLCWAVQGRLLQILGQINRSYLGLTSKEWHGFMAYIQASIYVALILVCTHGATGRMDMATQLLDTKPFDFCPWFLHQ